MCNLRALRRSQCTHARFIPLGKVMQASCSMHANVVLSGLSKEQQGYHIHSAKLNMTARLSAFACSLAQVHLQVCSLGSALYSPLQLQYLHDIRLH